MTTVTKTGALTFSTIEPGRGLAAALARDRADVLAEISRSGLRGRGGAGFPTSVKWSLALNMDDPLKYVICNADEGEPGTFKDRVILSEYADLVFEGMTIGARVIGARHGIVYLREEYTYLLPHLEGVLQRRAPRRDHRGKRSAACQQAEAAQQE
jgi:[NiFe] hydrogenase diaphorase moiety large subunit